MTGEDIRRGMAAAVDGRANAARDLLAGRTNPGVFLQAEAHVRLWRRRLERFRLESYVRFNGAQLSLADAEDLESAYETLSQLNYANGHVTSALRAVIDEGYLLPFDEDWT